ncbi:MAG: xylose isomerase [Spirochaetaceae bacterium]|nr:MAG: xylose isomerase [Spirochaetaceae bacterium]
MKEIFPEIPTIQYEGPDTKNPMAFRYYQADRKVGGKTMAEHLRFSMVFWHTMNGGGHDPFGTATAVRPWDSITDPMELARTKTRGIFELTTKLTIPFFCFHDRDVAPDGATLREANRNLDEIVGFMKELMQDYPTRLLWGTAQLFFHPRYMNGAATSPDPAIFAHAAGQVKKAMEVTRELGGLNYVFWGGREGYETMLNTDMGRELDNMGYFLQMARDYGKEIGFEGQLLIEPKPMEPTKHQYDTDTAAIWGFLQEYGLQDDFKLNIETNHATLAGHTIQHELHFARVKGILGSVDANQGDMLLGWDTDQFPTDLYVTSSMMYEILLNGGLHTGGLNFDAKVRRPSWRVEDLAQAHIVGMDAFARGLIAAQAMLEDGELPRFVEERYKGYRSDMGKRIADRSVTLADLEAWALDRTIDRPESGRQEYLESVVNRFL